MTEVVHLRCDRCELDTINDDLSPPKGWARVMIDLCFMHFCPTCWQKMLALTKVEQ